ncbi:protein kinase domain-containing protein [Polyangium mundeleinium]|uniref:Protein kinase n=1 Tax=Polyangium mundeleinium TaxID=2995306 RepID=A0ABT5EFU8_9BACT|nr:protein kinase [Polyangium mundeleinium]MDC0740189.1 protein kinase [Polyangium mundeleinium]
MPLSPGERFDRYVVEALLGEGGMGEVYRVQDTRLGRSVALKVLRRDIQGGSESWARQVRRMLREARIAAALNDPGIVAVYDVGEHEGAPFIAMELVQGKLLRDLVHADAPLGEKITLLSAVAQVLSVAHRAGLVHRDVKPENVMIREDGAIKVLDFGIARRTDEEIAAYDGPDDFATRTGDGSFVGTPAYMAPEQVKGDPIDARVDQFAWGVTAYELLAGKLPFRLDRGPVSLIASILSDEPPPMNDVPPEIEAVVFRALAKEPADRHASMDDIVTALAPFATPITTLLRRRDGPANAARPSVREPPPPKASTPSRSTTTRSPARRAATNRTPVTTPRAPARSRRFLGLAAIVTLGVAAAGFVFARKARTAPPPVLARTSLTPVPTIVTALPLPKFANEEARAAYREGLQGLRDGAWRTAYAAFARATQADPGLTSAWLRMAILIWDADVTTGREHFRRAVLGRATLDAHDQALLDAHEPLIQGTPSDIPETARRLALASARFPGNAELANLASMYELGYLPPSDVLPRIDRCLELDPLYGDCLQGRARLLIRRTGHIEEGLAALERCIEATPAASDCLMDRGDTNLALGRCSVVEAGAREWIAKVSPAPAAHMQLAGALYARGAPAAAVKTAVETAAAQFRAQGLEAEASKQLILHEIATGRFEQAERMLRDHQRLVANDPAVSAHGWAANMLIQVLQEMGRDADAGREAQSYIARRGALIADPLSGDFAVRLLRAELAAGLVTRDVYEAERAAWAKSHPDPTLRIGVWISGYALVARDEGEAKAALAVMPTEALSKERSFSLHLGLILDSALGQTYWLAGNPAAALPHLTAATVSCSGLIEPMLPTQHMRHTKSLHQLGLVRQALGDRSGACDAFGRVLARWGGARASRTAAEARAHVKALGCEAKAG